MDTQAQVRLEQHVLTAGVVGHDVVESRRASVFDEPRHMVPPLTCRIVVREYCKITMYNTR